MLHTGTLFDLAPDGLGFIADETDNRLGAFLLRDLVDPPEDLVRNFVSWEGKTVEFEVSGGKIRRLSVPAKHKTAAGGRP